MKNKKKTLGKFLMVILIFHVFALAPFPAQASEEKGYGQKAVVFVLDVSGSMKTNDPNRYAIDSIAQLIYTLPTNYDVGFAAYSSEICALQGFLGNSQRSRIMEAAQAVAYNGYSNAGAGLDEAVLMLKNSNAEEKEIVLLSDGEILMEDEETTSLSEEIYQRAVLEAAENKIRIHVIGLGEEMEDTGNSIFQAAKKTGGGVYYSPQALDIQKSIDSITEGQLHIKQMTAAIVDAGEKEENLTIDMAFAHAGTVRVLLTSDSPIGNLKTNFSAESARQIGGERYSLIEITRPKGDKLDISFEGTPGNQVRITLIPEYQVKAKADVTYKDSVPNEEGALYYERVAEIAYGFYDAENESLRLWTEEYFNHSKVSFLTEKGEEEKALEAGEILVTEKVREDSVKHVSFAFEAFPANVLDIEGVEVSLKGPELLPVEEPEPPPYELYGGVVLGALFLILIILLLCRRKKPRTGFAPEEPNRPVSSNSSYVGRLNIYITRTKSGYDISPLAYDLFRLPANRVVSIAEILENCGIKEHFLGAENIYLSSGQGRSIILTNQSDCCIMKSGEILMKKKSYQLFTESKVDITFEDEISELTFQYKDLKPSEMY
ncbi:MAG: VWA domain-containing protein [Lachnospiraceae bacterium]|nr:VWA domain-containing protein [Lachnospiraceae bacterium]MDE6981564.1 VWA domain-containing protein [Lachnospiraceae bacterium]